MIQSTAAMRPWGTMKSVEKSNFSSGSEVGIFSTSVWMSCPLGAALQNRDAQLRVAMRIISNGRGEFHVHWRVISFVQVLSR